MDTSLTSVEVNVEEDFLVAICYIADCYLYERRIDCDFFIKNIDRERNRMIDFFVRLIKLGQE